MIVRAAETLAADPSDCFPLSQCTDARPISATSDPVTPAVRHCRQHSTIVVSH